MGINSGFKGLKIINKCAVQQSYEYIWLISMRTVRRMMKAAFIS